MKNNIDKLQEQINLRNHVIAWLIFAILIMGVIIYVVGEDNKKNTLACVPKMQGFYQSLEDNYVVAVIGTGSDIGKNLANELQAAINQINNLQVKGR